LSLSAPSAQDIAKDKIAGEGRRRKRQEIKEARKQRYSPGPDIIIIIIIILAPRPRRPASDFPPWEPREYFRYELIHKSKKSNARVGKIHTPHGVIDTPGEK
jgi:hypothetical protein